MSVKIYKDVYQKRSEAETMTKTDVINLIENDERIYTCPDNPCVKKNGAPVRVVNGRTGKYIRSVPDDTERDNLGDLDNFC